ncbi:MAG: beta-N-acetylhexosaminidase [Micavibrio sp.]|nr:beta-N-acetylhexosaminidase [Micavibrio sp.]|tara:strand:- start:1293 stop:2267 length:975 start_codon:yes stop_codon:yes gene_type:complete
MLPDGLKAVIYSVAGLSLSAEERVFFTEANPVGFILFGRNCETPEQVKALCEDLRRCVGWHCPILIDQEGGRVQRLKPPIWRGFPPMEIFGARAKVDMDQALEELRYCVLQLAEELVEVGVNVDCAPVMDVLAPETHDVIGDRAFGDDPQIVGRLGVSVCRNLLSLGVVPVIKHIPGHGRATCDSHKELPRVSVQKSELSAKDFEPFRIAVKSDISDRMWAMASHVIYEDIDPDHPASVSPVIIEDVIRQDIGFKGFLVSDDLDMHALDGYGSVAERTRTCVEAGCDAALYCAGDLSAMQEIQKIVPNLSAKARKALQLSLNMA